MTKAVTRDAAPSEIVEPSTLLSLRRQAVDRLSISAFGDTVGLETDDAAEREAVGAVFEVAWGAEALERRAPREPLDPDFGTTHCVAPQADSTAADSSEQSVGIDVQRRMPQRPLLPLGEIATFAHPALVAKRQARVGDRPCCQREVGVVVHQRALELSSDQHQIDGHGAEGQQQTRALHLDKKR